MIDGLVSGRLVGSAQARTGQNGRRFVTAKMRVTANDGGALFASIITFSESTGDALLALNDGDSVSLSGSVVPKVWQDRHGDARIGLDVTAHAAVTAYHVRRKRREVQPQREDGQTTSSATDEAGDDL
ncbi:MULTISPECIES: single-stranded DNA-binding protein [unclassified Burkholderia]|uniref:single-stranded DNA-binding protein n=1 Tax=unclassified Burkholderia TaxID=2613784 RepID=UPI000F5A7DFB|nr:MULTISPECIES: single-stranded DNA-binding protein [unclassified Burkholderia]RQS22866.1 single-stranded DNA-binding protein [Burkholderia sp. Bp8995]RQS42874.1 single-stranded DNA-binding protein [Burkholderia sp. Bp8989]